MRGMSMQGTGSSIAYARNEYARNRFIYCVMRMCGMSMHGTGSATAYARYEYARNEFSYCACVE
jgi:hypothetical protein